MLTFSTRPDLLFSLSGFVYPPPCRARVAVDNDLYFRRLYSHKGTNMRDEMRRHQAVARVDVGSDKRRAYFLKLSALATAQNASLSVEDKERLIARLGELSAPKST
eukprot:m.10117 g.10117  ORF g.10117 m.10117 type:complete len:106 (-) comp3056_c0_seq2:101-418(-)